jgi:hypothetical protein
MDSSLFTYMQQLEMLAFFSGYPLIYYLVRLLSRNASLKNSRGAGLVSILPFAYALIGTLYLSLQLKNLYPDYSIENIKLRIQQPWLQIWGFLSILFWIPAVSKRLTFSVLHSLVFFFIILKDLFFRFTGPVMDPDIVKNDMRLYMVSIFLNMAAYIFLFLLSIFFPTRKKYPGP